MASRTTGELTKDGQSFTQTSWGSLLGAVSDYDASAVYVCSTEQGKVADDK